MPSRLFSSLVALSLLLAACRGGDSDTPKEATAADVLSASTAAMKTVSSFHFKLEHENGTTPMPLSLQLVSAEGDVAVPDKLSADLNARAASISASVKVIGVGDRTWITNPFNRRWQELPGVDVREVADPAALVGVLVATLQDPQLDGTVAVDGSDSYKLTGKLDSASLKGIVPNAEAGHELAVELWIGTKDHYPRRAQLTGPLSGGEKQNIVRRLDLSRFNAPVTIQPPE